MRNYNLTNIIKHKTQPQNKAKIYNKDTLKQRKQKIKTIGTTNQHQDTNLQYQKQKGRRKL